MNRRNFIKTGLIFVPSAIAGTVIVPGPLARHSSLVSSGPPSSGLIAQWESDAITGLNDGDAVASWPDGSGNSRTATQSSATLKPLFKTNIFGSKPSVRFDGSNDLLSFTTTSITNWTFFMVMTVRTYKAFGGALSWRAASQAGFMFWDTIGNAAAWVPSIIRTNTSNAEVLSKTKNAAGYGYPTPFPSGPGIICFRYNDTGPTVYTRRDSQTLATATTDGYTGVPTEGSIGHGYDYLAMDVGAVLVYNTALADADVSSVFTYLNGKYTVY